MVTPPDLIVSPHENCRWCFPDGVLFACEPASSVYANASWPEYLIADTLNRAGLHPHVNQVIERMEADIVLWPRIVEVPTVVEYDPKASHGDGSDLARDREKNRRWQAAGWRVIRIRQQPLEVLGDDDLVFAETPPSERNRNDALVREMVNHIIARTGASVPLLSPLRLDLAGRVGPTEPQNGSA